LFKVALGVDEKTSTRVLDNLKRGIILFLQSVTWWLISCFQEMAPDWKNPSNL
jgi:hypothetical protein